MRLAATGSTVPEDISSLPWAEEGDELEDVDAADKGLTFETLARMLDDDRRKGTRTASAAVESASASELAKLISQVREEDGNEDPIELPEDEVLFDPRARIVPWAQVRARRALFHHRRA